MSCRNSIPHYTRKTSDMYHSRLNSNQQSFSVLCPIQTTRLRASQNVYKHFSYKFAGVPECSDIILLALLIGHLFVPCGHSRREVACDTSNCDTVCFEGNFPVDVILGSINNDRSHSAIHSTLKQARMSP